MPATISVNFATQAEVETAPQPTTKSVSAKVLADVLGGGSLGGGYVRIAGSTMTGYLTLNAAPTQNLHAATKKYVDDNCYQTKYRYNIVSPTSTVSGPDANANTLKFTSTLNVDVYRNGVLLVGNGVDYTANPSPTNSIVFTTPLAAGAVVQINVGGVGSILAAAPGVAQIQAGSGITLSPSGGIGTVLVTNSGVTQIVAGTGISVNSGTGVVTVSLGGGGGTVPTGTIAAFPSTSAPAGWIKCNGAILNRADFPDLWTFAVASGNIVNDTIWASTNWGSFSTGNGSTTFRPPELRGEFVRGWADGGAADTGRAIGTYQAGAFKDHTHPYTGCQNTGLVGGGGSAGYFNTGYNTGGASTGSGTETRPRNISLLYCIKY